jgi:hypothetical protein
LFTHDLNFGDWLELIEVLVRLDGSEHFQRFAVQQNVVGERNPELSLQVIQRDFQRTLELDDFFRLFRSVNDGELEHDGAFC